MANVNANINVNVNTQQASAQLRKLSADISRFNQQSFAANSAAAQQQRALNQSLIDGVRTSGQFRTSIVPITSAVDRFATSIEKGQLSLGQYTRYAASQLPGMRRIFTREFDMINRVATSRVKTLNTQFVALGDSVGGAQKALAMTPVALDQYSSRAAIALQRTQIFNRLLRDGSTQLLNWGKNTQWAGRQLMVGFTIPLGILGAQAAKVFKELEAEAVNFRKVYGDMFTTDVEVEKNLQAVKELSKEMTKYGISIQQSMELANVAAQSGARGQDLISQTTEATRLAVLGQMEQQEAIKTTITLQNAFQLSNEELTESINFLNVVENQSVLSLQNVTEAIPRVAPVIQSLGGDVKDLSVMLVAMREGGVSAAEGANALKTSLARLVSPTAGAVKMAEKFGINLQNIVVENKGDILGSVMELADAMKVLDDLSQQQLMSEIFGKRQYARVGALFNNITNEASQAQRVLELTTMSTRDLAATAERELGAVEESVSAKFTGAMERAKLALAPVGEEFLKALTPVVDFIGKILSKFADLPEGIKTAIVAATGIIGGLAPIVLMVTGLVANGIANIGKFILFLRKQIATLRGNGEAFKMYSSAELEAAAAAASLEGKTSTLTATMHLQKPAIETLITLYTRLAASARSAAAAMPATMGGVGVPAAAAAAATRGGGFAAVAPKLPVAYRNTGGPIFESASGKTRVPGSGNTDTVPAMLTPGEFVVNKESTKKNLPLIKAINDGGISGSQSSMVPKPAEGIQYAFRGLLMQGLRRISGPVRPTTPSGKVFPRWFYDTKTGTNRSRQRMALEDSYQMGMRPKKPSGAEYSLDEIKLMKDREVAKVWKGVHKGHMAPSISMGEKTDFLPGIMGPMLGGGKGGNISMIRGGNPKEIYDMFSSMEARGIHPMSILFGASKELGYTTNPGLFMRAYNDIMQGLLVRRTNFGTGETFESWAYRIIKRNLGSLNNKDGNFIERMSSVGTVRGIDPQRSMKDGEYQSGRGSLYAAILPGAFGLNKGGMVPGAQYLRLGGVASQLSSFETQTLPNGMRILRNKKGDGSGIMFQMGKHTPFHRGHENLLSQGLRRAEEKNLDYLFAVSGAYGRQKEQALNPELKRRMILEATGINPNMVDPSGGLMSLLKGVKGAGYKNFVEVVGADRLGHYSKMSQSFGLRSSSMSLERSGVSGTLLRELAISGKFDDFAKLMPDSLSKKMIKEVYESIRSYSPFLKRGEKLPRISFNKGGMVPGVQYLMGGAQVLSRAQQIRRIQQTDVLNRKIEDQSLASLFNLRFNDVKDASSPSSFVKGMFSRWDKTPTRVSPKESTAMLLKGKKPRYPQVSQEEYLADMIISANRFSDVADVFKPITVGKTLGRGEARVFDGHTRIHAQTVMGLIESQLGRKVSSMSKDEIIEAIRLIRQRSLANELTDDAILSSVANQRVLTKQASRREVEGIFDHPLRARPMQSMYNFEGRTLIPGIHDREIDAIVNAASKANFYGVKKDSQSLMRSMGFVSLGDGDRFRYDPKATFRDRTSYQRNIGRKIVDDLIDTKSILPLQRNKGGEIFESGSKTIVPGVGNTDTVPAALTPGEFVVNKKATQQNKPLLKAINDGKTPGFNKGGMIPGVQYFNAAMAQRVVQSQSQQQKLSIERDLAAWLGGKTGTLDRQVNFKELAALGVARPTRYKNLYRGIRIKGSEKGYAGFPKDVQDALHLYGKTGDPSYIDAIQGRVIAIEPRSFSKSMKVARQSFAKADAGYGASEKSPVVLRLTDREGIFGANPQVNLSGLDEQQYVRQNFAREKEIIPVGDPSKGNVPDSIVVKVGLDKAGNIVLDSGAGFSKKQIKLANKELQETRMAATGASPRSAFRGQLSELEKLENRFRAISSRPQAQQNKQELEKILSDLAKINSDLIPGTKTTQSMSKKLISRRSDLYGKIYKVLGRSESTPPANIGIDDTLETISGPVGYQAPKIKNMPEGNTGGLLVSGIGGKNSFYRNKGGKIPGMQYLWGGGVARYISQTAGKVGIQSKEQARAIESRLGEWLGGNMKSVNFRELLKTGVARETGKKELFRGVRMAPADKRYLGFPPEIQNALFMYGKTRDRSYLDPYLGRAVAIEPRSFSQKRKVAKEFSGANESVESSVIFRLTDEKGLLGVNPYAKVGTTRQSKDQAREARSFRFSEREIIPVGNPAAGQRPDAIITRIGIDKKGDVVLDSGSKFSRREISRANRELDDTKRAGLKVTPKDVLRKELVEIEKLENRLKTLTTKGVPVNDKKFIDEVSQMFDSIQLQKGYVPGTYNDRKLISKIESRKTALADRVSRAFNAAGGGARLNKGGMAPQSKVLKANAGTQVPGVGNTDTVPAMLTPGEFVVNKEASQKNLPLLHAINDGQTQFLSEGAPVSQAGERSGSSPINMKKLDEVRRLRASGQISLANRLEREYVRTAAAVEASGVRRQIDRAHTVVVDKSTPPPPGVTPKAWATDPSGASPWHGSKWAFQSNVENNLSNLLATKKDASGKTIVPPAQTEMLKRLKNSTDEQIKLIKQSNDTQERKDRRIAVVERRRAQMTEKLVKNLALNNAELKIQAKLLKQGMLPGREMKQKTIDDVIKMARARAEVSKIPTSTLLAKYGTDPSPKFRAMEIKRANPRMTSAQALAQARNEMGKLGTKIPTPYEEKVLSNKEKKSMTRRAQTRERVAAMRTNATDAQTLAKQIKASNPGMTSSAALQEARSRLGIGGGGGKTPPTTPGTGGSDIPPRQSMYARANAAVGKFGMGAGMGLSMAGMLPMMSQDEEGKFMGMDAGTAMIGMMGGGTLLSLAPMMGAAAIPIMGIAAVAGGVGLALKTWRNNVDETSKKTADLGANIGGTANALNTMAQMFGEQTPIQRRAKAQLQFTEPEQEEAFGKFQNYLGSELGQKFIKDLENSTSAERFKKLSDYLKNAIAGGILSTEDAKVFAKTVATSLGDPVVGQSVLSSIRGQLTGSRGMLDIARERDEAIQQDTTFQTVISQEDGQKIAYADAGKVVGSSLQAMQDFGNAAALASEQYFAGTMSFDEYTNILTEATKKQNEYSDALQKAIESSTDLNGTMMAISDQLLMMGLTEEQKEVLMSSGKVSLENPEVTKILKEQVDKSLEAEYGQLVYNEKTGMATQITPSEEPPSRRPGDQFSITQLNMERVALANEMFTEAESRSNEILAASLEAVTTGVMSPAQAKGISDIVGVSEELYSVFTRLGSGAEGLLGAAFVRDTQVREIEGLDEEGMRAYSEIGVKIISEGYDLAAFRSFIDGLPESKRINIVTNMQGMSNRAQQAIIATGAMGPTTQGTLLGSSMYQRQMSQAANQRPADMGGLGTAERGIEAINDAVNDVLRFLGDETTADLIIAVNTLSNGKNQDFSTWIGNLRKLERQVSNIQNNFPPEIYSQIEIDFTSAQDIADWNKMSDAFALNLGTLEQLDPNVDIVASMRFLTLGADGEELTPEQVAKNVVQLNSAWNDLKNSTDKEVRGKALLTIGTAMMFGQVGENGQPMDMEAAGSFVDQTLKDLAEKTGGKVYNADPNIVMESIQVLFDMSQQREQAQGLLESAKELSAVGLEATASKAREQAAALLADADKRERQAVAQVKVSGKQGVGGGVGGGGGGGGGAQSPLEGFKEGILNQYKMWVDASAKIGDINNAKKSFVDQILKGNSIFDKLSSVKGISASRLEEILGMGPEGAQEFLDKYVTKKGLNKKGKSILRAAALADASQIMDVATISTETSETQTGAAKILRNRGASSQVIQTIAGDTKSAETLVALQDEYKKAVKGGNEKEIDKGRKALNRFIKKQVESLQAEKDREEAFKSSAQKLIESNNETIEANNEAMEEGDYYFEQQTKKIQRSYRDRINAAEDQVEAIQDQIDSVNDEIEALERLNRQDEIRIRGLERQKEMLSRQIEEIDRANELDERRIDTLSREDEIRNRVADALGYELEQLSKTEEEIRETYNKRMEALDKVIQANDYIINQQKQQVNLSRAISEGDIYAATQAAQEMRAESGRFALQQVRGGLETGMQNQLGNLRTASGLTREEAEERIEQIKDQSYQTSLQIRDIEDEIYNRNLEMIPLRDQILNYDMQIRDIQDVIYGRETEILNIQVNRLDPLQQSLERQQDVLENLNDQLDAEIESIKYLGMNADQWADSKDLIMDQNRSLEKQNQVLQEEDERLAGISKKWNKITRQIVQANKAAQKRRTDLKAIAAAEIEQIKSDTDLTDDEIDQAVRDRINKRRDDLAAVEANRQEKVNELLDSGQNLGKFAGGIIKYATGGIINPRKFTSNEPAPVQKRARGGSVFGTGTRDSVPAMLTPGEFVIRKAMVDKYGSPFFEAINQGAFSVPRYSLPEQQNSAVIATSNNVTSVSAPVYNTYDMKFSINGSNQNPDEIANQVMFKMRQLQNQNIRGNRGY